MSVSCLAVVVIILRGTFGGTGDTLQDLLIGLVLLSLAAAVGGAIGSSTVRP